MESMVVSHHAALALDVGTASVKVDAGSASPFLRGAPARVAVGPTPSPWRDLSRALHWCGAMAGNMRHMVHAAAGFCPPHARCAINVLPGLLRARALTYTCTQAPRRHAREFQQSVPASPTRMLVCMPCGENSCGWRVRATGRWPGLVRLPRRGVGRGPGPRKRWTVTAPK